MEQFLYYLLRASVLMALFYGFYKLFFGKNTFHHFNRFSLIFIVMAVVGLPVFRFNLLPEKKTEPITETVAIDFSAIPVVDIGELPRPQTEIPWTEILTALFVAGLLFAVIRYFIGVLQLIGIIRKSEKQTLADDTVLCVTDKDISPFSWLNYIVLSRKDMTADNRAIISHERWHIHLRHSVDMIFFDLFTCVFWFNPFSWLLRREIQSVHEYQADEQVLNNGIDARQYQLLLIRKSVGEHKFALANNFRRRDLHKRITMMMKTKSKKQLKWNYTAALPVLFLVMVVLSVPKLNAKVVEKEIENSSETEMITPQIEDSVIIADAPIDLTKNPLELGEARILPKDSSNFVISFDEKLTVSGLVRGKGKSGFMSGVAVLIKGSAVGTITDPEGKFVIKAGKGDVLRFVMVGYKVFEYNVEKAQENLVIVLQPDDAVAVDTEPMPSLKGELQGIRTRDGKQPLYIVDGIRLKDENELEKIDKNNIESISVLKDASATAVYGEDGKNGVVLITTKTSNIRVSGAEAKIVVEESDLSLRGIPDDKKPLIIVDGEKKGKDFQLNTVKPDEIESISVLKDKSAEETYGEDGKNGVILITKKKR